MNSEIFELHLIVSGRVQGVGFRFYTQDIARKLKITGWVKNTPDGRVEILCFGTKEVLQQFIDYVRKGPSLSYVKNVNEQWEKTNESRFTNFSIAH